MSFNFSDIEEEEDFDLEEFDETGLLAREKGEAAVAVAPTTRSISDVADPSNDAAAFNSDEDDDSDGGDWDNVDWEDAADKEEEEEDADNERCEELPSFPQEGITIHIGRRVGKSNNPDDNDVQQEQKNKEVASKEEPPKKKPRKATVRVLRDVSPQTQQLVLNIRRSHLVCCMIHSMQCSLLCSGGGDASAQDASKELMHTALSLIPQEFHTDSSTNACAFTVPTASTAVKFADWFFHFVNHAGERRRSAMGRNAAQGATAPSRRKRRRSNYVESSQMDQSQETPSNFTLLRRLRYLSPCYDEEPQLFLEEEGVDPIAAVESITAQEKVMLFLIMVRSMGWRARFVTALPAIPLKLTVDHPLFKVSSPPTASLNTKPSASELRNATDVIQNMVRLMREGKAEGTNGKKSGRRKRAKQQKPSARRKHGGDTIDLVSSGEEERGNYSQGNIPVDKSLSWIEVLRCKDEKGGGKSSSTKQAAQWTSILLEQESVDQPKLVENILAWMDNEANNVSKSNGQVKSKGKKGNHKLDRRSAHQTTKKSPVSYVLAVEHLSTNISDEGSVQGVRFTDVTRRYASTWARTLSLRGATSKDIKESRGQCVDEWFKSSLKRLNSHFRPAAQRKDLTMKTESKSPVRSVTKVKGSDGKMVEILELESSDDEDKKPAAKPTRNVDEFDNDDHDLNEKEELDDTTAQEVMPKSKAAFKNHPFYVIPSVLNSKEVIHPDARKRICGVFKGELVYRRSDVSTALKEKKWLYEGRKVKDNELQKPVKKVKARKKPKTQGFQALESYGITESAQDETIALLNKQKDNAEDDEMDNLYGIWQTDRWSPPYVSPSDPIPTNEHKNVEKELLNPGLTHMEQPRLAGIARKLGIPYAPCMLGFEPHGGRGTPLIRGIVVHDHNVALIREASIEWESHVVEKERNERRKEVLKKWKRLVVGLLTKERLERDYGGLSG